MARVGIALGSNLGERRENLQAARQALREISTPGTEILQASIYQTEPLFCPPGSPVFYNSLVELDFLGSALDLLNITQAMEKSLGRNAVPIRNAPRIIDIDLLYFGDEIIAHADLILPHPRLHERRFVLQPLAEIRPDLILPGHFKTIAQVLGELRSDEPTLIQVVADW
jgi:2-amino-4-hydroxy-6-hydroxymethyldihydropteridine diphosphokinase